MPFALGRGSVDVFEDDLGFMKGFTGKVRSKRLEKAYSEYSIVPKSILGVASLCNLVMMRVRA